MLNGNIILEENNGKEKFMSPMRFLKKRSGKTLILESGNVKNMVIEVL